MSCIFLATSMIVVLVLTSSWTPWSNITVGISNGAITTYYGWVRVQATMHACVMSFVLVLDMPTSQRSKMDMASILFHLLHSLWIPTAMILARNSCLD